MRFDRLKRREFITLLGGVIPNMLLWKAALAGDPFIFEIISVEPSLDQRTGQPIVGIRLKDQRPFTKMEAEKQVLRTLELRVDGTAIFKAVVREPPYVGTLQIFGSTIDEMHDLEARISRAVVAGSRLELAVVD